ILESVDQPSASTGVGEELLSADTLPARLIVVEAMDRVGLLGKLHSIQKDLIQLKNPDFIQSLRLGTNVEPKCRLAIVVEEEGRTHDLLGQAIKLVSQSEPNHSNADSTDLFYSEKGLSHSGGIGFVFPGSGNHFMGMGRELALFHPDVLEKQEKQTHVIASQWLPDWFWDFNPSRHLDDHPEVLIFGQVTLGTLVTDVLEDYGIRPSAAIGYSLGETAALFSTRAWTERDEMVQRVRESSLFTKDLAGPCLAAKRKWNLDEDQSVEWMVGVVNRNRLEVEKAIEAFSKVYLLIVNSPEECVIGGDRCEVEKLVRNLQAGWVPVPGVPTVHCDVVESVEVKYRELHRLKINVPEGIRFYSGAWGESYDLTSERAVDSITAQALHGLNFQKTILSAYEDGVRFFVEMGPGNSCSRMIRTILKDKDFATRPIVVENQSEVLNLIRLVAHLHVEGFSIDFSSSSLKELTGWASAFQSKTSPVDNQRILVPLGRSEFRRIPLPEPLEPKNERRTKTPSTLNSNPSMAAIEIDGLHSSPPSEFQDSPLIAQMDQTLEAGAAAHQAFLEFCDRMTRLITQSAQIPTGFRLGSQPEGGENQILEEPGAPAEPGHSGLRRRVVPEVLFDREQCMAIAIGSIAKVLGDKFAEVDGYPTRVRLPDEPLMLVDRILSVEGEPCSMKTGRVVTEHDVLPDGWYLDGGRIPTCIAVEAGQADLFLSGFLGIDFQTKGLAVYRLLDADVTFHDSLPGPNSVIHYDIHIDEFFRQGNTWLFRFNFESTVDGKPLLSMEKGCAGFFTEQELDGGKGIVHTELDLREIPGIRQEPWVELVPMVKESYTDSQLNQ
ncbi:MAG TPA: type I polyketide synthase, partial [Verrucomicrobia bacterium]|nr:type I polyketide synthase [Verrucomicrobiota bacterium]